MKGPLAIEKSNFLIEPIDTPFSSRLSADRCCCTGADTGKDEGRVMTLPRFPLCSAALNPSIWIQMCFAGWMRGGEERVDEKGWGREEGRIIGELIQRETDRGGGRRLWSAGEDSAM